MYGRKIAVAFLSIFCALAIIFTSCVMAQGQKIKVVTSTSLLEYIAKQVGGDVVEVVNLIPPVQHPGNFNVRPGDVTTLASGQLFLYHGWPGEGYVDKLVTSANNPKLVVFKASVNGNWMIPSVQSAATDKVAEALVMVDSANSNKYYKNAADYKNRVSQKEKELKARFESAKVASINVIASHRQADFLQWAGFNVVATYAGPNTLNPQTVRELVDKGKANNVKLVIDNLQDGKDAGKGIAEELGAIQLNLSNFPGGFANTETWEKAIDYNATQLLNALK